MTSHLIGRTRHALELAEVKRHMPVLREPASTFLYSLDVIAAVTAACVGLVCLLPHKAAADSAFEKWRPAGPPRGHQDTA